MTGREATNGEDLLAAAQRAAAAFGDGASPAEVTEAVLKAIGFNITEEGKARWRGTFKPFTPEERAENERRLALIKAGAWPDSTDG